MPQKVTNVEVWAGELEDVPGGLARVLKSLAGAGAKLECVIARRDPSRPGTGQVFVTPVKGKKAEGAARSAGLSAAEPKTTLQVEGADRPGLGQRLTSAVADAGINLRGVSAAVMGKRYIAYFGFDTAEEAGRAAKVLKGVNGAAGGGKSAAKRRRKSRR